MQVALQNKFDVSCILLLPVWLKNQGMQGKGIKLALHVVENAKKNEILRRNWWCIMDSFLNILKKCGASFNFKRKIGQTFSITFSSF